MAALIRRLASAVVDPHRLRGLATLPRYVAEFLRLRRAGLPLRVADLHPQLADRLPRTPFDPHYLLQAAWLARRLRAAAPARHVDVGSDARAIAVISAFVPVEFVDIRPLPVSLEGLECRAGDICHLGHPDRSVASLSCLHVIEHIGLGRYGDPLDPQGHRKAAAELERVLAPGGRLYLSTPVGRPRVEFNAHRVFAPQEIPQLFPQLRLQSFSFVGDDGLLHEGAALESAATCRYACGLFELTRPFA